MDAALFVEQLDAANQEILSRLAPAETLVAESGGDLRLENLLKIALKNELEATEIAARWLVSTPDIEVKLALARQAGDEARHYRLIEAHLQELGADLSGFDPLAPGLNSYDPSTPATSPSTSRHSPPCGGFQV